MAAAQVAILAATAASIAAVVAGSLGAQMAKRKVMRAVAGVLGAASAKIRQVHAKAAQDATEGGGKAGQPEPSGKKPKPSSSRKGPPASLPDAPDQIAQAVLNAQQDAGQAFDAAMYVALGGKGSPLPASNPYRDVVDKAMRRLTGIGADVKDLTGPERAAQSLSRLQASQVVLNDLAARGLTGYTDSKGRRWSLDAYAEMATRTAASRLHLSTQLASMAQAGNRLVIIDDPSMTAPCPKCRPWIGRVVALSGDGSGTSTITDANGTVRTETIAGTLAEAIAAGLHHPNCRCSETPWTDGAGAVATVGGKERGYVQNGQPISKPLPIGTPRDYTNEQRLRGHERNVRAASMRVAAAATPQAKSNARAHLTHARAGLEAHVKATGVTRLPQREKAGKAR